jgi:hypothetical protein
VPSTKPGFILNPD